MFFPVSRFELSDCGGLNLEIKGLSIYIYLTELGKVKLVIIILRSGQMSYIYMISFISYIS